MSEISPSPAQMGPNPGFRIFKRVFFTLIIIFFLCFAVALLYYNGKSIYDHGI